MTDLLEPVDLLPISTIELFNFLGCRSKPFAQLAHGERSIYSDIAKSCILPKDSCERQPSGKGPTAHIYDDQRKTRWSFLEQLPERLH